MHLKKNTLKNNYYHNIKHYLRISTFIEKKLLNGQERKE